MPGRLLLTIGIPTYNRSGSLNRSLDILTRQIQTDYLSEKLEILVSDNDSPDNTKEIVERFQRKFSYIRYSRNESNLEFDRNVQRVLKLAQGQFCWTMSDDDLLKEGAVKFVLDILQKNPDAVYMCVDNGNLLQGKDSKRYANGDEWLKSLGLIGGLLSQNIYNREFLPNDIQKYYDNFWIHFSIALEIMAKRPALLIKNQFLPEEEGGICRWAVGGHNFTTYLCLYKIIQNLPSFGYDRKVVNKILYGMAKGLPRNIASARMHGLRIDWNNARRIFSGFKRYWLWSLMALAVFFVPRPLLSLMKKVFIQHLPEYPAA